MLLSVAGYTGKVTITTRRKPTMSACLIILPTLSVLFASELKVHMGVHRRVAGHVDPNKLIKETGLISYIPDTSDIECWTKNST